MSNTDSELWYNRMYEVKTKHFAMNDAVALMYMCSAHLYALDILAAWFAADIAGTATAATAVKLKLGILTDDDEFSATCNIPATAQAVGRYPFIIGADRTVEIGESLTGTSVGTYSSGPEGNICALVGVSQ